MKKNNARKIGANSQHPPSPPKINVERDFVLAGSMHQPSFNIDLGGKGGERTVEDLLLALQYFVRVQYPQKLDVRLHVHGMFTFLLQLSLQMKGSSGGLEGFLWARPGRAEPPIRAKLKRAEPSRAKPSRAKPSHPPNRR